MTGGGWILASGEDSLIKIVIGLIVAVIWVAVQVYQKVTEKGDKSLPPSRPPPQRQTPPEVPTSRQLPQDPPITGQAPPRMKRQKPPRRAPQQPPPRPVRVEAPAAVASLEADTSAFQTLRGPAAASGTKPPQATSLPSRQVVGALLKPRNLRKAFVLTEILGPPAAMRGERDRTTPQAF